MPCIFLLLLIESVNMHLCVCVCMQEKRLPAYVLQILQHPLSIWREKKRQRTRIFLLPILNQCQLSKHALSYTHTYTHTNKLPRNHQKLLTHLPIIKCTVKPSTAHTHTPPKHTIPNHTHGIYTLPTYRIRRLIKTSHSSAWISLAQRI